MSKTEIEALQEFLRLIADTPSIADKIVITVKSKESSATLDCIKHPNGFIASTSPSRRVHKNFRRYGFLCRRFRCRMVVRKG